MKKIVEQISKNDLVYSLTKTECSVEEIGNVTVYGIDIFSSYLKSEQEDISADLLSVKWLFELAAEEELFPEHLKNVVEDFIS